MANVFKDFVLSKKSLEDKLFEEVSDYDIYCELTGVEYEVGRPAISLLRLDDDNPSFSLFIPTKQRNVRQEELWWRDFRDGWGNVFKFVKIYADLHYGIVLESKKEIIEFIDTQLELGIFKGEKKKFEKRKLDYQALRETMDILFKSRPFTPRDLLWWCERGIDESLLKKYDIRSIQYLLNDDFTIRKRFSYYDLAFAFVIFDKVKIYRPDAPLEFKWRNTCPAEYIMGWKQLEGHDTLIITKSMKDILTFKSFMNADVIAPQSESSHIGPSKLNHIKQNYKNIYVVFDYDDAGKIAAERLQEEGFIIRWVSQDVNPKTGKPDDKDMSDFVTNHPLKEAFTRMQDMFHELDAKYFRDDRLKYFDDLCNKLRNEYL
jgi:hypothetical protein